MIDVKVVGQDGVLRRVRRVAPIQNRRAAERLEHEIREELCQGLARKSINNHLAVLRRSLAIAVEWGLIESIPVIRWLELPPPEFDFLTTAEAHRLIEAADPDWHCMIIVAVRTGLRLGELLALRWVDVDLDAGRVVVRRAAARGVIGTPKNGKMREVPLSEQAADALRIEPRRGEFVFCAADGAMLTRGATKWPLRRALARSDLRAIGWHTLRHSFASQLVMRGAPLKSVQELLGHSTIEMTMRYSHLSPDARRQAVRLLDAKGSAVLLWKTSAGELLRFPDPLAASPTVPLGGCGFLTVRHTLQFRHDDQARPSRCCPP